MKKTLLACLLIGGAALAQAQRTPGHVKLMQPLEFDMNRGTDTVYSSVWDNPDTQPVIYGVTPPPEGPGGYILGTNGYGDLSKVQAFLVDGALLVDEIIYWFGAVSAISGNPNSHIKSRLYNMNGPGTTASSTALNDYPFAPGTILASQNVPATDLQYDPDGNYTPTSVFFNPAVQVGTEFAAGFEFGSLASQDTAALVSTLDGVVEFGEFCWEQWDNGNWFTLPGAGWGGGSFDVDAFILVVVTPTVGIGENWMMNNMRMTFLNGNLNNGTPVLLQYDVVQDGRMTLVVHNAKGQVMHEQAMGNQAVGTYNLTLDTQSWANGNYYVTLRNNGLPLTMRLVVAK
ncbi:MAG: T9SS type A sorting domain-containing protein [Flavobacteriales bacterium]|nr:T9SS type A sorting domain-containing protein [Flavobacteriales bacterium]